MNNQQTWNRFKEIIGFYAETNLRVSTMRNSISLVFVLFALNCINIKIIGADLQTSKGLPLTVAKETSFATSTESVQNNGIQHTDNINDYKNTLLGRLKTVGGGVSNIKIVPEYIPQRNKIVFNVSWDKPIDQQSLQYYDFIITPNSSHIECRRGRFELIKKNRTLTSIYLPPVLNPYEIFAGCAYIISIVTYHSNIGKLKNDVAYTLPECVGKKCSCRHLSPQVTSISVVEFSPGQLNISWEINHVGTNETTFNITNVILEYRPPKNKHTVLNPFSTFPKHNISDNLDYLILPDAYKHFTPEIQYELQATFYNTFDCKVINYTNFSINAIDILQDAIEHVTRGFSWEIILIAIFVSVITFIFIIYIIRRNRLILKEIIFHPFSLQFGRGRNERNTSYIIVPSITTKRAEKSNPLYVAKEIEEGTVDRYEFPRSRIVFSEYLKSGEFGEVHAAKALNIDNKLGYSKVAVKLMKEGAPLEEKKNFLTEIEITKKLGQHPHIVKILGCCKLEEPYFIIMEYIPCGDLLCYLQELRKKWEYQKDNGERTPVFLETSGGAYIFPNLPRRRMTSEETEYTNLSTDDHSTPTDGNMYRIESSLDHNELEKFALQIAQGMEHLERIGIVHRDLAARNVLINEFRILKISDFGMSRVSPYVSNQREKVPLRWIALEAIENHFYDNKGDIWSFAVVLWEIGTLGAYPYPQVKDEKLSSYLQSGRRMDRPEVCTDDLYSLMLRCWSRDRQLRPSFEELVQLLLSKKKRIYVDFSQLNPLYVFPPCTEEKPLSTCDIKH